MNKETVVVTGGGTGMGRAVAMRFAEVGYRVVIAGRREEILEATAAQMRQRYDDCEINVAVGDLSTPAGAGNLAAVAGGRVRAVVCAAGGNLELAHAEPSRSLEEVDERWRAMLDVNLMSAVLPIAALDAALVDHDAAVVLVTSQSAADGRGGSYAAVKAGVNGLARVLALDLGSRGVTVNAVMPGVIPDTDFFPDDWDQEQLMESARSSSRTSRVGTAGDVADAAYWLCSRHARHITGQALRVDGGATFSL